MVTVRSTRPSRLANPCVSASVYAFVDDPGGSGTTEIKVGQTEWMTTRDLSYEYPISATDPAYDMLLMRFLPPAAKSGRVEFHRQGSNLPIEDCRTFLEDLDLI